MADEKLEIPVGSGDIYEMEFTGTIPADNVIETESNRLGHIEKGATVTYKPTTKTFKDDFGRKVRTILTEEEATLKLGLIAWCYSKLRALCSTARVTETAGKRTVKIGGVNNADGKKHLFRFYHPDVQLGDVRITIVGTNTGGFSLAYAQDDSTKLEPEITAEPSDDEGTLILFEEQVLGDSVKASGLSVSSAAGSTSGTTKLTVTPTKGTGNSYRLYHGAVTPSVGQTLAAWEAWDGSEDVSAATGDIITIAEVDSGITAVKAGIATVTAKV